MATILLYVKSGPANAGVRAISFDDSFAVFTESGDNTMAKYRGLESVSGTVVYEDDSIAEAALAAVAAEQAFIGVDSAGADATVTITGFCVHETNVDLPSGFEGGDVPATACSFVATAIAVT